MRRRSSRTLPRRLHRSRRLRPDVVLTLASLGCIALLAGLAHWLQPPLVPLGAAQEGARVAVEARVLSVRDAGSMRVMTLADDAHRMPAFAPPLPAVDRGDVVRAQGIVSRVDDGLALSIESFEVTMPTARTVRAPAELAASPRAFDGALVVVRGEVREGMIVGGGARVALRGEDTPREGTAIVTGTFAYREADASYVVWVDSWTRPS